jgi:hypothetical protein
LGATAVASSSRTEQVGIKLQRFPTAVRAGDGIKLNIEQSHSLHPATKVTMFLGSKALTQHSILLAAPMHSAHNIYIWQ